MRNDTLVQFDAGMGFFMLILILGFMAASHLF
jgi:hypothetical protein